MIAYLTAIILGIVEGLTEFLPVSSTAHLILLIDAFKLQTPPDRVFEVFIQLGAISAVVALYFKKLLNITLTLHTSKSSQLFARNIIIATIPAVIIGFLARDFIKAVLYSPFYIAIALILGGIIILVFEQRFQNTKTNEIEDITLKQSLIIGLCQALALIPGVSRSGATIMGALSLGVARTTAAEFSFFLAIPVMFGAVAYDTYKSWDMIASNNYWGMLWCGFFAAFFSACVVIKTALNFIKKYGFKPFAYYRIALGLVVLLLFYA
jgi:undecaprenyl-diphosphatase